MLIKYGCLSTINYHKTLRGLNNVLSEVWTHLLHRTKELSQEDLRGFYESIGEVTKVRIVTRGFEGLKSFYLFIYYFEF